LSVWWDRSLIAGSTYDTEIDKALTEAKAVIVIWSQAAVVSEWVRSEADEARGENKLVPVKIEDCRVPLSMRRLQTADLSTWKGERTHEWERVLEAVKARVEGRVARPSRFVRRLTLSGIAAALFAGLGIVANFIGVIDYAIRLTNGGAAFAVEGSRNLTGEEVSPETQEGFRDALAELARSADLRTQRALTMLERSDTREEALGALQGLASDQGAAIDDQMRRTASLWRQIGLLRFNENPLEARAALEKARRYDPTDPTILTALGALYQREGRIAEADEAYRIVLSQGALDGSLEGRLRQVLGQAHLERGEVNAAEREFKRSFELAEMSGDDALVANLFLDLGLVEIERGNLPAARRQFTDAREFAVALDYPEAVAYADYNAAEALIGEGQLNEADALLRSARQAAEAQNDSYLMLFVDLAAARLSSRRGEHQRALDIAQGVRARADEGGVRRAEVEALMQVAESQLALGHNSDAAETIERSIREWRELRAANGMAIASSLEAVVQSRDPARAAAACAALRPDAAPEGNTRREIARLSRYATCPS
jgi:tetratricopeptide (TPR) repeat protein